MTTPRDFLGQELAVGDLVIYPVLSGRSCQMTLGRILKMDVVSDVDEQMSRVNYYRDLRKDDKIRTVAGWQPVSNCSQEEIDASADQHMVTYHLMAGTIRKATVQPVGLSSRWTQYSTDEIKPVHLTANAMSMVKAPEEPLRLRGLK